MFGSRRRLLHLGFLLVGEDNFIPGLNPSRTEVLKHQ
jgi:hypothetical protein